MKIPSLEDVQVTAIDGVRTFWIEAERPFTGAIVFRVGMFDERLRNRGVTHLVEHLALSPLRDTELNFNGTVEGHQTTIWAQGEPARVADFLAEACRHLTDLPIDRLETERGVLEQESTLRQWNYSNALLNAYFGPRGPGMGNYYEYGLTWLGAEDLATWSARYFTKANAALVFTGKPPASLRIDLPLGESRPLVAPDRPHTPAPLDPTLLDRQKRGVSWGTLAHRPAATYEPEFGISLPILTTRLGERLRHELGRVYASSENRLRLDGDLVFLHLGLDCAEEHSREVSTEFIGVMERYGTEGPTREEIDRLARIYEAGPLDHPDGVRRSLVFAKAEHTLCGWGGLSELSAILDALRNVDLEAARSRFVEAYSQSYYVADPEPLALIPTFDPPVIDIAPGVTFRRRASRVFDKASQIKKITVGRDGVKQTWIDRDRGAGDRTVEFSIPVDEIELVAFFGSAVIVEGHKGSIYIDTGEFHRGDLIPRTFTEQLPEDIVIPSKL